VSRRKPGNSSLPLESLLENEVTASVKARKYERNAQRQGQRGGHYLKNLLTRYGLLENLRALHLAEGPVDFQLFDKWHPQNGHHPLPTISAEGLTCDLSPYE
jgi:hypothetical protein